MSRRAFGAGTDGRIGYDDVAGPSHVRLIGLNSTAKQLVLCFLVSLQQFRGLT